MRQLLLILTALLACAATLHGEEPEERRKIVFTPQWTSQCQFAGYYVAQEKGYYADAGLEVEIRQPSTSKPAIEYLKSGESQIITMQLAQALYEMGRGAPLVNILQTSQQSSLLLVSRRPVKDIHDLRGKRIGCWKTNFAVTAQAADHILSLQIEWIPFIQNINLFISGAIDGTLATSYNEYYQLLFSGVELNEEKVIRFSRIGYDSPKTVSMSPANSIASTATWPPSLPKRPVKAGNGQPHTRKRRSTSPCATSVCRKQAPTSSYRNTCSKRPSACSTTPQTDG